MSKEHLWVVTISGKVWARSTLCPVLMLVPYTFKGCGFMVVVGKFIRMTIQVILYTICIFVSAKCTIQRDAAIQVVALFALITARPFKG